MDMLCGSQTARHCRRPGRECGAGRCGPARRGSNVSFRQAENPITSPEVVMRTSLQKSVGGYDARLPHAADMEMWLRLAANADVGFIRGVDQAYYRLHRENMRKAVQRADGSARAAIGLMRRCLTATARGCPTQTGCLTSCTGKLSQRRFGLPDVCTIGNACGRLNSPGACWARDPAEAWMSTNWWLCLRLLAGGEQATAVPHSGVAQEHWGTRDVLHAGPESAVVAAAPVMEVPGVLTIFGRELVDVCVKFQAARGRRAWLA